MNVFTVDKRSLRCTGVGFIQLDDVEVLVVDGKLLGFDLLLGFDVINTLGGVCVTSNGSVSFPQLG